MQNHNTLTKILVESPTLRSELAGTFSKWKLGDFLKTIFAPKCFGYKFLIYDKGDKKEMEWIDEGASRIFFSIVKMGGKNFFFEKKLRKFTFSLLYP